MRAAPFRGRVAGVGERTLVLTTLGAALLPPRQVAAHRPVFNQVWAQRFGDHRPARSAVEAADFGRKGENARFMVEVTAFRG